MKKAWIIGTLGLCLLGACNHQPGQEADGHAHAAQTPGHPAGEEEPGDHAHGTEAGGHGGNEIVLTPERARAAGVEVEEVKAGRFREVILTSGQVLAAQGDERMAVAPVAGVVSFTHRVTEGMPVTVGSSLVVLSARHLAEGDPVQKARVAYEVAQREYERQKALVDDRIVSEKEFAQARQAYENARISYEAVARNHSGQGQVVKAPVAGYVKSLLVKEGDYVDVGQPLVSITQNRRLFLRADVSERYYQALPHIGSAHFRTPYDGRTYRLEELNGRLLSTGKAAGDGGGYVPVTFELDNRGTLVPGAFVEVYLLGRDRDGVTALPETALTEEQGSFFVYRQVDDECYVKQRVTPGASDGLRVEIREGVKPGDRIVTRGAYQVKLASATNAIPAHTHEH